MITKPSTSDDLFSSIMANWDSESTSAAEKDEPGWGAYDDYAANGLAESAAIPTDKSLPELQQELSHHKRVAGGYKSWETRRENEALAKAEERLGEDLGAAFSATNEVDRGEKQAQAAYEAAYKNDSPAPAKGSFVDRFLSGTLSRSRGFTRGGKSES